MKRLTLIAVLLVVLGVPTFGASSFVGPSGNIVTPDNIIVPPGTWEFGYHRFVEILGAADFDVISLNYGLVPDLEVGVAFAGNGESDTYFSAKYRLLPETAAQPTIVVGTLDVAGTVNRFGDPSFYILVSKNITPTAARVVGEPIAPLQLTVGFGSGLYDGIFAGLDWTVAPQLSLMVEFVNNDLKVAGTSGSTVSAGARYALTDTVRVDAALIDFQDFAFGASLRTAL